jgi:predicted nucleic acid-binding protein
MMLKYLLDTNVVSELMRPIPNPIIVERVDLHQSRIAIENWFESGDNP